MISKQMEEKLNEQINKEMYSSYLYLAMSAYLSEKYLDGFAHFFRVQSHEEWMHAMKIYDYINEQGGRVELEKIEKPPKEFKDVEDIFTKTLEHEKFITKSIQELFEAAMKEKDYATAGMLDWFVKEQIEEEANMDNALNKVKMAGNAPHALMFLNEKFGQRKSD